jgi:hypothetical protein
MTLLAGRGEWTDLKATPDAIAPAGDEAIDGIGEERGDEAEKCGQGGPGLGQLAKGGKDGTRADEDRGAGRERLADDQDGAGSTGGIRCFGGCGQERCEGRMVGRGEAQPVIAVVAEEPLNGGVAKAAVSVIDDQEAVAELGVELGGGIHY